MAKKAVKEEPAVIEKPLDENQEVSVELDENNQVLPKVEPKKEEPRYVRPEELQENLRKSNAAFFAEQRKIQARLDEIATRLAPREAPKPQPPASEWDEKVQKDWKGTVEELADARAEAKYRQLREREIQEAREEQDRLRSSQLLENNKRTVMQRHPELDDPTSDKARAFQEVISRNPDYLTNPFGPVLAMRDMEDELRAQGKIIDEPTKKIVDTEMARRARTSGTAVPNGNGSTLPNKVVLTKDEREYCDAHKIKYETFASTKQTLNSNREIVA